MTDPGDDEQSWIACSRKGDHQAFEALVARYQKMIHALTFRMTGSMTEAEDLAQETFIAAYEQLPDFRAEAKFSSWLYRIATNRCLNWLQRDQRRERAYQTWAAEVECGADAQDEAVAGAVQAALLKLEGRQRAAVILTTYEGLNHAEAARILGCSEATVSWRIFAARRKLKKLLRNVRNDRTTEA